MHKRLPSANGNKRRYLLGYNVLWYCFLAPCTLFSYVFYVQQMYCIICTIFYFYYFNPFYTGVLYSGQQGSVNRSLAELELNSTDVIFVRRVCVFILFLTET